MLLHTPLCDFGWRAPHFSLADAAGKHHHFADLMGENGLVVAFICNHCPYVIAIIDRLVSDAEKLAEDGIAMVAIMANDYQAYPDDAPDTMAEFASRHHFSFPYLIDETQEVAKAYGAVCTPDFFGLNAAGELHYRGRLDDAQRGDANHRRAELLNVMRQMIATGKGPDEQIASMGCSLKWRN